jgi:HNH endonuclease
MPTSRWTEPELIKALSLYRQIPFGRMHRSAPEIIALAAQLGRTPSSVAMKLSNFASLDPELTARGIAGLKGASKLDRQMWQQYANDWTELATALILPELASDQRKDDLFSPPPFPTGEVVEQSEDRRGSESQTHTAGRTPSGVKDSATSPAGSGGGESRIPLKEGEKDHKGGQLPTAQTPTAPTTESDRLTTVRYGQPFFRRTVLSAYDQRCCITGLAAPPLLRASHIIPWAAREETRLDPHNGLCLNALHDAAFDRGLMTLDEHLRVVYAKELWHADHSDKGAAMLKAFEGVACREASRYAANETYLDYHRNTIFAAC